MTLGGTVLITGPTGGLGKCSRSRTVRRSVAQSTGQVGGDNAHGKECKGLNWAPAYPFWREDLRRCRRYLVR